MKEISQRIIDLPSLRDVVSACGFAADKKLGQHFIFDLNITNKIVRLAGDISQKTILEVGPGPGALTRSLFLNNAKNVVAVDYDDRVLKSLAGLQDIVGASLKIYIEDALKIDESMLIKQSDKLVVVSNLPYNISTELLFKWFDKIDLFSCLVLMFQKEVAERICARPGNKSYGKISVIAQWLCDVDKAFNLPASAFTPPPKVESAVVVLKPLAKPRHMANILQLKKLLNATFQQRRKMLRVSLKNIFKNPLEVLEMAGINSQLRPENLTVEEFCRLSNFL